jgi:hypothetical protein
MLKYLFILSVIIVMPKGFFSQVTSLSNEKDEKVIKENLDNCTNSIKKIYKRWLDGKDFIEEEYNLLQSCYTNFYDQIKINEDHSRLITSLLDRGRIKDERISGGLIGLKYEVKDVRGRIIGEINKINGNQFKFNGEGDYTFMQKKVNPQSGDVIITFRQTALDAIYKALNLQISQHQLTIMSSDKSLNNCTFRLEFL